MATKYEYNPEIEEIYLCKRGKHKGVIGCVEFNYGHTFLFSAIKRHLYIADWNEGYFADKYVRRVGKIYRPRWDKFEMQWVLKDKQVERKQEKL